MAESPRIIELQQKFEDNPRRYFASLANEYRKAGDFQRAISICRIYLEGAPSHTAGHVVLGQALHATGKMEEAKDAFGTVLQLDPENLIALKCLGEVAQTRGDSATAHDNFRKVLIADPRDYDTNRRLKEVEEALKLQAAETTEDWIPPRTDEYPAKDETGKVDEEPPAEPVSVAPALEYFGEEQREARALPEGWADESPDQTFEENFSVPEVAVAHEDVLDGDSMDTLLPSSETDHYPTIAEPVALESVEDTLVVPDLMKDADIPVGEEFQYRTAEYTLPKYEASDAVAGASSVEMELEAQALLSDGEIPPAPLVSDHELPTVHPMRTGEFSLSRDTAEWNPASGETAAHTPDDEPPAEMSGLEPAGPFITETVAELYLQQGFTGEALLVYRQLARTKPNDQRITDRIAALERKLGDEHAARQAALDTIESAVPAEEPELAPIEVAPAARKERTRDLEEFDRAWAPPAPVEDNDDWFATPDVAPVRARQTVHEFFALLGSAKAEVRRTPVRVRVSADDIRNAADVAAGFGAFGVGQQHASPKPISPTRAGAEPQDDVRRFRVWLDGLSDS